MAGVLNLVTKSREGSKYFNSSKFVIIGPSGSGKTVLAANLAVFVVNSYSNIVYISPASSGEDRTILNLKKWCKRAEMPFFQSSVTDKGLNLPRITHSLYIVDDYYTSTGRPSVVEKLIKELFNRGRHDYNHVIYIAQCDRRLQPEVIQNNNGMFVKSRIIAEKFGLAPEMISHIPDTDVPGGVPWFIMKPNQDYKYLKVMKFPDIKNIADVVKKLKNKIPLELRKDVKKLATNVEYREINAQTIGTVEPLKKLDRLPSKAPLLKNGSGMFDIRTFHSGGSIAEMKERLGLF